MDSKHIAGRAFFMACVRWTLGHVSRTSSQPIAGSLMGRWPADAPSECVQIMFILEEGFWLYCDTDGRRVQPTSYKEWMAECRVILGLTPEFWRSLMNYFTRYKNRMPVASCLLLSSDMQRCVLVRSVNAKTRWVLPGGKCHEGLETITRCMAREMDEEVAVKLEDVELLHNAITRDGKRTFHMHIMRLKPTSNHVVCIDRRELCDARWFNVDNLHAPQGTDIAENVHKSIHMLNTLIK